MRGPIELVPGVLREEGIRILQLMDKAATETAPKNKESSQGGGKEKAQVSSQGGGHLRPY